jgi:hypothetical protein
MTMPTTIIVPGIVSVLERFLRPLAATSGAGIEIRQTAAGTSVIACEGRHAATITTRTAGNLEPILVDPAALADADPSQPIKLYRMSPTTVTIVRPSGELVTVPVVPGELPRSAKTLADAVEGEIASGSTRAVFELDPRHLLAAAEALVATGAEKVTIAIAPRWNALAAMAESPDVHATFLIAGEPIESPGPAADQDDDDPLTFTIEGRKPRGAPARRRPPAPLPIDDDIPF